MTISSIDITKTYLQGSLNSHEDHTFIVHGPFTNVKTDVNYVSFTSKKSGVKITATLGYGEVPILIFQLKPRGEIRFDLSKSALNAIFAHFTEKGVETGTTRRSKTTRSRTSRS